MILVYNAYNDRYEAADGDIQGIKYK